MPYREYEKTCVPYHSSSWSLLVEMGWVTQTVYEDPLMGRMATMIREKQRRRFW